MHWIDWAIMILPLAICGFIAVYTSRYVRSVADFMAGGRGAGRFLICTARSEQGSGAAVFVATFQVFLVSGFTLGWWGQISTPIGLLLMVSGFVIYRYRQTRAMTLGQFFEMRYSRKFRLFAGMLGFFAGLVNFGIIPAVGARFMVSFLGWPQTLDLLGFQIPTFLPLMAFFLTVCVIMTTTAGQVSVLVTDCAEGMFSQLFYTLIAIILLWKVFDWNTTRTVLLATAPGESLVNPFDSGGLKDFNIWYVIIGVFGGTYRCIAWQNSHAFNSSAATPHESRMGGVLGRWRNFAAGVMVTLLSVCALTYFRTHTGEIDAVLNTIKDPSTRDQMRAPLALTMMLPTGVKGMLMSICLMGIVAGDGIHLHSWGSILIQDVVMPLRKKPLTPEQHIRLLRLSIVGVALWAFCFGAIFPQTKYVSFWWGITEAIFVGGAGIAIIGGLYFALGTTKAAWTALIVGSIGALTGILTLLYYERVLQRDFIVHIFNFSFRLNFPWITFWNMLLSTICYVVVSYFTCKEPHNMDRLLNRGKYSAHSDVIAPPPDGKKHNWLYRVVTFGIDEHFSRSDRWITIGITIWSMFWFSVFVVGSIANLVHRWENGTWATYYLWTGVFLPLVIGTGTTVWFTIGCWHDMKAFFKNLREEKVDVHDDGSVSHHDDGHGFPVIPTAAQAPLSALSEGAAAPVAVALEDDDDLTPDGKRNLGPRP